jgi:hypothetical protein
MLTALKNSDEETIEGKKTQKKLNEAKLSSKYAFISYNFVQLQSALSKLA